MRKFAACLLALCIAASIIPFSRASAADVPSTLNSEAIYLVNSDTGTVLYQKNADEKLQEASITKVMTALLTVENVKDLNTVVTVKSQDLDPFITNKNYRGASVADLRIGEQLTVKQLLELLLVDSACDASYVLARTVAGSTDSFVEMMNSEAKKLGAKDTNYVNPHGLQDDNHYTTAYDTYLISKYAMTKYKSLRDICDESSCDIPATNKHAERIYRNYDSLILKTSAFYYAYAHGVKTGSMESAGACLASYATNNGYTYYCIVLGGKRDANGAYNQAFRDSKALYEWAYKNFSIQTLLDTNTPAAQVSLNMAWKQSTLLLVAQKPLNALVSNDTDIKKVQIVTHIPKSVDAPVKKYQKIGTADVMLNGKNMGTVNLVAGQQVKLNNALFVLHIITVFFSSPWFIVVAVLLAALLIAYIVLTIIVNNKKKRLNRRRRKYTLK